MCQGPKGHKATVGVVSNAIGVMRIATGDAEGRSTSRGCAGAR